MTPQTLPVCPSNFWRGLIDRVSCVPKDIVVTQDCGQLHSTISAIVVAANLSLLTKKCIYCDPIGFQSKQKAQRPQFALSVSVMG
jgi:hypothetical protein